MACESLRVPRMTKTQKEMPLLCVQDKARADVQTTNERKVGETLKE